MAIDNEKDIKSIADRLDIEFEDLEKLLSLLVKKEIIRFDNNFSTPQKPDETKSLNFWIHTTNACNLDCSYYYISTLNTGKGMSDIVRQQLLHKFVEAVRIKEIKQIKFRSADGEPMS